MSRVTSHAQTAPSASGAGRGVKVLGWGALPARICARAKATLLSSAPGQRYMRVALPAFTQASPTYRIVAVVSQGSQ